MNTTNDLENALRALPDDVGIWSALVAEYQTRKNWSREVAISRAAVICTEAREAAQLTAATELMKTGSPVRLQFIAWVNAALGEPDAATGAYVLCRGSHAPERVPGQPPAPHRAVEVYAAVGAGWLLGRLRDQFYPPGAENESPRAGA